MNNRKSRAYTDGTAALKIERSRSGSAGNIVQLGRAQDGRLVVDRRAAGNVASVRKGSAACIEDRSEQVSSLRDDLRVAFDAMGFKSMERNLFEGGVASRTFSGAGAVPVIASSALSFAFALLLMLA